MKTIGLIGGMGWESSDIYYQILNREVGKQLGGLHSCPCILYSVDFEEISRLQHEKKWDELTQIMIKIARSLEAAGAQVLILCTNTMHIMADEISEAINVPFLHIAEVTANKIKADNFKKVALLGTRFTMEQGWYQEKLQTYGIETITPDKEERELLHHIIYNELIHGRILESSKVKILDIVADLVKQGAEGIILGCTEIPMILEQKDTEIPLYNTTRLHALAAIEVALRREPFTKMQV